MRYIRGLDEIPLVGRHSVPGAQRQSEKLSPREHDWCRVREHPRLSIGISRAHRTDSHHFRLPFGRGVRRPCPRNPTLCDRSPKFKAVQKSAANQRPDQCAGHAHQTPPKGFWSKRKHTLAQYFHLLLAPGWLEAIQNRQPGFTKRSQILSVRMKVAFHDRRRSIL